jgi:DNA mismatch repair protein MutL
MADIIRLLPDNVANQIAAGEVVQRPASVVKELLENSVDADASEVQLIAQDSGKTLIQVSDNGKGMTETDARMALQRHATSKIRKAEDIFSIMTKGFRGEALASIAAVAKMQLKTRQANTELGTEIKVAANEVESQEYCQCPQGTSIKVQNLFYNIPARRNFLKSNQVELRHIIDEFERVAMAHPEVAFRFEHNGSELFNLPPSSLRQRIVNIFGKRYNEKLVPVDEETEVVRLEGFVGKPEFAKKTRGEQFFFVNHRYIRNGYLHKAVQKAFEGLLLEGSHPSYFLFMEIDPARIDVNIHPTKTEIKFEDERVIHSIIRTAVKHSLGQYNIAPSLDFEHDQQYSPPPQNKSVEAPGIYIDPNFNPFDKAPQSSGGGSSSGHTKMPSAYQGSRPTSQESRQWESLLSKIPEIPDTESQKELLESKELHAVSYLQIGKKYLLKSHGEGLMLIHQARAHQRILFEKMMRSLANQQVAAQQLLFPVQVSFNAGDYSEIVALLPSLREMGFDLDEFGQQELIVHGIPLFLENPNLEEILHRLLEESKNHSSHSKEDLQEKMAAEMAKVAALKVGTVIEPQAMAHLVDELFACENPYHSPDGRPTIVNLALGDLDKTFA